MNDFQWIFSDFLLRHLRGELTVSLAVLLTVIAVTAVFVGIELRGDKGDGHADK